MSFWGWIAGGGKAVEDVAAMGRTITEGVVSGLDHISYTEEEKAEGRQLAVETILKFWEAVAHENTEQSKARRELAKMTFKVFFSLLLMAITIWPFNMAYALFIFKIAGAITFIVSAITVIYFGPHQISKIWKKGVGK